MQHLSKAAVHLAAGILLALSLPTAAQVPPAPNASGIGVPHMPMESRQDFPSMQGSMYDGPRGDMYFGRGPQGRMPPPEPPMPGGDMGMLPHYPLLRGLKLEEAQADKVFAILHAQAPAVRNASKALYKANEDLRNLALSGSYDASKAQALADAVSHATGQLAMLRADADHRIWDALTDEQRRRVETMQRPARGQP